MLEAFRTALVNTIYPPRCLACTEPTDRPHGLCPACWRDTHFIAGTRCRKCGVPLIGESRGEDNCETCRRNPPAWDRGAAAILYAGAGRKVMLALKHADRLDMVPPLAGWMATAGRDLIEEADLIAPVPLHWIRLLRRRYNQSAELARRLGRSAGRPMVPDLLVRRRATPPQTGNRIVRAANQAGALTVNPRHAATVAGRRVLLVDDVLTTGATLSTCADCLRAAGAGGIDVLVLARVAFEDSLGL
ncbi:MAG: ComF family protein [Amaricoccus sp.]